jgi:magnesium chelatase subunit D
VPLAAAGRYVTSRLPRGRPHNLALDATLRAAAAAGNRRVCAGDFREKVKTQPQGASFLFLVDASGSMGANRRMVLTKGILLSLLRDAYHKRDRVALMTFRAAVAELVLPFTRSQGVARRQLERLRVGGKTPLGLGLREALAVFAQRRRLDAGMRPVLVVVSDGNGNVAIEGGDPYEEALRYARRVRALRIRSLFIDTEEDPCAFGWGRQVARAMGGAYLIAEAIRRRGVIELPL